MSRIRALCLLLISTIVVALLPGLLEPPQADGYDWVPHYFVYCIGDSLTAAGYYEGELGTLLGPEYTVANKGIGANTTTQMLQRFSTDVLEHRPEFVVIWGGVNDISLSHPLPTIQSNLQSMYTMAHNAGITVIAIAMSPWKGFNSWTTTKQTTTDQLRTWIKSKATNTDYVIDIYPLLAQSGDTDALAPAYDNGDHLHLNAAAGAVIGQALHDVISNVHISWIARPGNVAPTDAATRVSRKATLQSTAFSASDNTATHVASQWQVRETSSSYASPVYDSGAEDARLTTIALPSGLLRYSTTYAWRVRHQSSDGRWSAWSEETSFTTKGRGGIPSWIWIVVVLALVLVVVAVAGVAATRRDGRASHMSNRRYRITP